ncbi:cohesin complex subunit [Cladophialophora chaetospira]|uniref:Cohesin complex subunit n=1 Tax=Cladophialophora chaetospira TaxID=386627 RepID=A0AA38XHG0_9EURO|nr:cohesin complex subunit [Cladophialophora chaetospira]
MEVDTTTPNGSPESRRKSGRTVRTPAVFSQEKYAGSVLTNGSAKRKRADDATAEDDEEEEVQSEEDDDEEEEEDEDEPDEEEMKAQRRAKRTRAAPAKPATKRTKTTAGPSTTLAIRSANIPSKTASKASKSQKARARPSQAHQAGLYAEVFGRGQSAEDAASAWFESVQKDSVAALKDLVNFVLQCIGCDSKVENQDIEDLDSVPNKLGDMLLEYEQQKVADYPLVSKQKQYAGFQDVLEDFFSAIVKALHTSSAFYDQPEIYDNIYIWVATMSGANYKSFRHTATVISLTMSTALCQIAKEIQDTMATLKKQLDAEKKKKNANKGRIKTIEEAQKAAETKLEAIDTQLRDAFDTVYVHRYRDVEERIRAPCVAALGDWIVLYRKMFLEGQYLRYLGWVLNDTSAPTRLQDIKQLQRLFNNKHNVAALRAFTDRFRSRLVEMGARDADIQVRAEAIELLDKLRDAELLEPDDIDTIGRLIFDSEPRIRKSVAKFFVSNIEDLYASTIEDFDQTLYQAALQDSGDVEDFMVPTRSWIKFKCLGSVLSGYDNDEESLDGGGQALPLSAVSDSRYTLATQSIFSDMADLQQWEDLAGYLLYDHSSIPTSGDDDDIEFQVQQAYKLSAGEDAILLDVLQAAVKSHLQSILEPPNNRRTNATKDQIREKQENTAQNLTVILPQLLNKFGSTPRAASSILRIEQLLDIGLINDLQSGEATYSGILDDISKQFTSHSDKQVLAAASAAFRNARGYEQSKDAADAKVQEIWTESVTTLAELLRGKAAGSRGTLDRPTLTEVVNTVIRLAELAGVYDCSHVVEGRLPSAPTKKQKGKASSQQTLLNLLLQLLQRGEPDEDSTVTFTELEDQLCTAVIELFSRYFRWKVFGLKQAISANDEGQLSTESLTDLALTRTLFVDQIVPIIQTRAFLDAVRYHAILNVLELFALFTTVRNMAPEKGEIDEELEANLQTLITHLPDELAKEVLLTFEKTEKSFARKTHRKIETMSEKSKTAKGKKARHEEEEQTQEEIEKPPEDSDEEAENSDVEEEDDDDADEDETAGKGSKNAKKQAALLAEQSLCELTSKLIFAIVGGAIRDEKALRDRVLLNRTKLGKNFTALVAYLDEKKKPAKKASSKAKGKKSASDKKGDSKKGGKKVVSEEMVLEDDDIEDPDRPVEEDVDEEEAQRRREVEEDEIEDAGEREGDDEGEGEKEAEEEQVEDDEIMGD